MTCLIARPRNNGGIHVVGMGYYRADGMRNGVVVDMQKAEVAIRKAVETAEQRANERIDSVIVNTSGIPLFSHHFTAEHPLTASTPITGLDTRRLVERGQAECGTIEEEAVHCIPTTYKIDGEDVEDPRDMYGETLSTRIHLISAAPGPVRNLLSVIERCHLNIAARVATPYASGLSCLVEDEKNLGVTLVDMGGGSTSIAVFEGGHIVHTGVLPVGGSHITNDLARGLTTSIDAAERLKTMHGCSFPSPSDAREILSVPILGEEDETNASSLPKSEMTRIIQPRVEETCELIRDHLRHHAGRIPATRRVVLTGGGSQLQGIRETASMILDKQIRLGRPVYLDGLPQSLTEPSFATSIGLLLYAVDAKNQVASMGVSQKKKKNRQLGRVAQWLLQNF